MKWTNTYPRVAVAPDGDTYVIYSVGRNGDLTITGKHFDLRRHNGERFPRPRICALGSPQRAMDIAERVQRYVES